MVCASAHWDDWYGLLTLTVIVDLYAVIVVGAPFAVPIVTPEARIIRTTTVRARALQNFVPVINLTLANCTLASFTFGDSGFSIYAGPAAC